MDANFLREHALFWSLLGFCYDPPIPDETGAPRLFDHHFARYTKYHHDFADAGVDVRLMIPAVPDHKLTYMVAETYWGELLRHGVKIYKILKQQLI